MTQPPRPKDEHIINKEMRNALIVRSILQTAAVLGAFVIGLYWHLESALPAGKNILSGLLEYEWQGVDVTHAVTMAFVGLSLVELFRANTVRSERIPLVKLGLFSNKTMQGAVLISLILLLLVVNVPFLQEIFNTTFLTLREWLIVVSLTLIPSLFEEIKKMVLQSKKLKN